MFALNEESLNGCRFPFQSSWILHTPQDVNSYDTLVGHFRYFLWAIKV
jgi:hypothetical protein